MKRAHDGGAVDSHHPALAFHREVITIQQWSRIRKDFLLALEAAAQQGVVQWREPKKLWRHAQEALGKWILSQVARVHLATAHTSSPAPSTTTAAASTATAGSPHSPVHWAEVHEADIRFFPNAAQLRAASGHPHSSPAAELATYDSQLIRDLSIKSNGTTDAAAVEAIVALVKKFDLPRRCVEAAEAVEAAMDGVTPANSATPRIRRIEAGDRQRSPQQQRIAGPIAEVAVQWPRHWRREQCRDCPPVSLPWAAIEKLRLSYSFFSEDKERALYDTHAAPADGEAARRRRFELRAATVILRYEGGLATGSLQLCADTRLKQHLHAAGYHVMDLCASPINAYMGTPQPGCFASSTETAATEAAAAATEVPNRFCSAFFDTDRYFGSMGSAVSVDPLAVCGAQDTNPEGRPLLLTLDVPYDEDLCELLFLKLVRDMRAAAPADTATAAALVVDYVLVLPLWWDIQMKIRKRVFAESGTGAAVDAAAFIRERAAMLKEGYVVPYTWPGALAEAAGTAGAPQSWVCFDGVFIDDRYGYFCTNTNQWLHGVTTTEVIGLAQPRCGAREGLPVLQQALDAFYGAAATTLV